MSDATKTVPQAGTVCWNELGSTNCAATKAFYETLFGWTSEEMPMPDGPYTIFKKGETQVAGMFEMKSPDFDGVPPHWLTYIAVDDVDASAAQAESLGATIMVPPSDIPNVGRFAVLKDPVGTQLALFKHGGSH